MARVSSPPKELCDKKAKLEKAWTLGKICLERYAEEEENVRSGPETMINVDRNEEKRVMELNEGEMRGGGHHIE